MTVLKNYRPKASNNKQMLKKGMTMNEQNNLKKEKTSNRPRNIGSITTEQSLVAVETERPILRI